MRERKYRAWDKTNKKMWYSSQYGNSLGEFFRNHNARDDTEIMDWIGLKDKNGKEIFEGDIVVVKPVFVGSSIGLIKWSEECACFFFNNGTNWGLIKVSTWPFKMEIAGNIHENSELLEQE